MATTLATDPATRHRPQLTGNALVLAGIAIYLLEFVGFALAGVGSLYNEPGTSASQALASYAGTEGGYGFLIGWLGIVLFGRLTMIVGVRKALSDSGRPSGVMDVAIIAMGSSVVVEIASVVLGASAATLAARGEDVGALAVDRVAWYFNSAIYAPVAVALVLTMAAMWRSGLFSKALCALGSVGAATCVGSALLTDPARWELQDTFSTGFFLVVAWALWTGVVLLRQRRP
ncbi:hypothetical protein [Angustibacter sp. Root456]|uniref:hypothetical protein n=1 Tax=Angustibacter sp. Root456 TaxID=1736539 RepID=UPI0006FEE31C|nr:hypothetical protein [Angustibacter sp. Root456]KQX64479.1 hypothetical protein ASD06_09955 [Angustibacter sp. Root456]